MPERQFPGSGVSYPPCRWPDVRTRAEGPSLDGIGRVAPVQPLGAT